MPFPMSVHSLRCFVVIVACCVLSNQAHAQPLAPDAFSSLGTLNLSDGDYTIDTDTLTIFNNAAPEVALFTGVADNQGGAADYLNGDWVPGSMGIPEIAVFTFDGIDLAPTANVTITGTRAIALLSQGDATVGTPLSVDGSPGVFNNRLVGPLPGSLGGPGGFAGGAITGSDAPQVGEGPGGGNSSGYLSLHHSGGGFGGQSHPGSSFGLRYGDLAGHLQGGSGGGAKMVQPGAFGTVGPGGGGAIELGANGVLTIDADISATGGHAPEAEGTGGSGGGIRVDAAGQVVLNARLVASGGDRTANVFGLSDGAGGRIFAGGLLGEQHWFVVGQPNLPNLNFDDFPDLDVTPGSTVDWASRPPPSPSWGEFGIGATVEHFGVITLRPGLTIIPTGETAHFGQVIDVSGPEINLTIIPGDLRILSGGTFDIGAGVNTSSDVDYELAALDARITGTGTLAHAGTLSGTGRVKVAYDNLSGAEVQAVNNDMTFTHAVTNQTGGQVNAISSTLHFDAGLANDGHMNLINTTVTGDVVHNGVMNAAGVNTFTGTFSGDGIITGNATSVFTGLLSPGNSPGTLAFEGDLVLGESATLEIEIGGTILGDEHDRIELDGFATLEGELNVTLIDSFIPELGDNFGFLMANGGFDVSFSGLNLPDLSALGLGWQLNPGGSTLFLEVVAALAGDFNGDGVVDGTDFLAWQRDPSVGDLADWQANYGATAGSIAAGSAVVPEPSTLLLGTMFLSIGMTFQRYRK